MWHKKIFCRVGHAEFCQAFKTANRYLCQVEQEESNTELDEKDSTACTFSM